MGATYSFKDFTELTEVESDEVLQGRNDPEVRRWMTSDRVISSEEHRRFMGSLKKSTRHTYLKVARNGHFAGVYSLTDMHNGFAVGGFWVTAYARERLLSLSVVFQSIRHVFEVFPIDMIRGYQLKDNRSVAKLNALLGFGFSEAPIDADPRMQYLALTRLIWLSRVVCDSRLLKLVGTAESRNED